MSRVGNFIGKLLGQPGGAANANEAPLRAYGKLPMYAEYRRLEVAPGAPTLFSQWMDAGRLAWVQAAAQRGEPGNVVPSRLALQLPGAKELVIASIWDSRDTVGRVFPFSFFVTCPPDALGAEPVEKWASALSIFRAFDQAHSEINIIGRGGDFYRHYRGRTVVLRPPDLADRVRSLMQQAAQIDAQAWFAGARFAARDGQATTSKPQAAAAPAASVEQAAASSPEAAAPADQQPAPGAPAGSVAQPQPASAAGAPAPSQPATAVAGASGMDGASTSGGVTAKDWFSSLARRSARWRSQPADAAQIAVGCPLSDGPSPDAQIALWLRWLEPFARQAHRTPGMIAPAGRDGRAGYLVLRDIMPDDFQLLTSQAADYGFVDDLSRPGTAPPDAASVVPPQGSLLSWLASQGPAQN